MLSLGRTTQDPNGIDGFDINIGGEKVCAN